ncbi:fungal-specific transcription factor domain-containing protein [Mycena filopes]|nr:fungal-specific transcription factor domain-containing protein [Mycena filopes]
MFDESSTSTSTSTTTPKARGAACSACRKRKIRCDGMSMPNGRCSNCRTFNSTCTYAPVTKRGTKSVAVTEAQKENMQLRVENATLQHENATLKSENVSLKAKLWALSLCPLCKGNVPSDSDSAFQQRFSNNQDATTAEKQEDNGADISSLTSRLQQFSLDAVRDKFMKELGPIAPYLVLHPRRRLFWDILPWEKDAHDQRHQYVNVYPEPDLIASLVQLYFINIHPTLPVLHRPSFEQSVADGLFLVDHDFGGLLLSVLAVASRYSDDPRVFVDGDRSLSSGWKFANQIQIQFVRQQFEPSIYEVQMCCLMGLFVLGTSTPEMSTVWMALGMSFLQLRTEYRQKRDDSRLNFEDESWRRVFWSYQLLQMSCVCRGFPPSFDINLDDVDLPLEVDDEYWDRGFVQPLGKPSVASYFVYHSRLCEMLGDTMQRLYGSERTKARLGSNGPDWEYRTVAELDSAMNAYSDSIPAHLCWDPDSPPEDIFFDQAALLHISYHHIQLMIHRPFIHKMGGLGAPSLFICMRAARTIIHTAGVWLEKRQRQPLPSLVFPVFLAAVILGLNVFGLKRTNPLANVKKDVAHQETAMEILKLSESRMQITGRLRELLGELKTLDPLSLTAPASASHIGIQELIALIPASPLDEIYLRCEHEDKYLESFAGLPRSLSPHLKPGVSIEQLLADTNPLNVFDNLFEDEIMSMWMTTAPADFSNIDQFYTGNRS